MFCKRPLFFLLGASLLITLLASSGCARHPAGPVERLGVMPIDNLSSDPQWNWLSRAAPAAIAYDLSGAKTVFAKPVDSLSAAESMQANRMLEGYFVERNGRLAIHATLEDLASTKVVGSFDVDGPVSGGLLPLVNELARRLSPAARMFGTSNEDAFRYYGEALVAGDPQAVQRALQQATMADPGFAAGYVDEAKLLSDAGDRQHAREVIQAAGKARLDPIERADLEYITASVTGDIQDRLHALNSMAAATPANAEVFAEMGQLKFARRQFQPAVIDYREAARLNPDEPRTWNELGYALAWSNDLKGAQDALAEYQKLDPEDPNVLDSQGEVSYLCGDFKSASDYFERAAAKNPAELMKAAEARLMMGDRQGADALFAKHFGAAARARGVVMDYQMAQWQFLTGRRSAGVAGMEKVAGQANGDLQALALTQLAVWKLESGDAGGAADLANQALARAQNPQVRGISALCRYIAVGVAGSSASSGSKMADAYALLFAKKYREAIPLLQTLYSETNPSADGQVRTALAWAYVETGAAAEASKLVDCYPLPLSSGEPLFASMVFPRYLFVRAAVLEREGKHDEANKSFELYSKYGGQERLSAKN